MKNKVISQMVALFTASLAFIAALAWNEAVQNVFNQLHYFNDKKIVAQFLYAMIITVIAVFTSTFLAQFIDEDEQKDIQINDKQPLE